MKNQINLMESNNHMMKSITKKITKSMKLRNTIKSKNFTNITENNDKVQIYKHI